MALEQQTQFLAQISPFDLLERAQLKSAAESLDVVYFKTGQQFVLSADFAYKGIDQAWLYFVIKGIVAENVGDLLVARYSVGGFIGARYLLMNTSSSVSQALTTEYSVLEEAILYRMPARIFLTLMQQNADFSAHFNASLVDRLNALHDSLQSSQSTEMMMQTVCCAPMQPLVSVAYNSSLLSAVQAMVAAQTDACVVAFNPVEFAINDQAQWGIVTASDVLKSVAAQDNPQTKWVGDLAHRPLYSVHQFDYLFNALLKMTRYQVNRLVVRSDQGWIGFLHQKELMSLFANQSGLALLKIDQACSIDDLKSVIAQVDQLIASLNRKGIKTHYIAKLVAELHRKLLFKLTQWLLPEALHSKVCLLVMGSEGRSEQVIRTDQDNALIVQDGLSAEQLAHIEVFALAFNKALLTLGFPSCPGNIMVSNPQWRKTKSEFIRQIDQWFERPDSDSFMNLAIFYDAQVIMGDANLLTATQQRLNGHVAQQPLWLRHFAKSALQFETPVSFFGALITQKNSGVERMDIKKGGIFPIVHGVRCYALQAGLQLSNTHWRIKALIDAGVLDAAFGEELGESLNFFNTLRLEAQLNQLALNQNSDDVPASTSGLVLDNFIQVQTLTHLQQDLLKQALGVVAQFKKQLIRHFKLQEVL